MLGKIIQLLIAFKGYVAIRWVPSHVGITGNEEADKLAKESVHLPISAIKIPFGDMKKHFQVYYQKFWQVQWTQKNNAYVRLKPVLQETVNNEPGRREQQVIARLRLGTCLITNRHVFKGTPPATCSMCQCRITVDHIMTICPKFIVERRELKVACVALGLPFELENLLSETFPHELVIIYIARIGYLDKI